MVELDSLMEPRDDFTAFENLFGKSLLKVGFGKRKFGQSFLCKSLFESSSIGIGLFK